MIEVKEFRNRYLSQSTDELLFFKYKGGLTENAKIALESVLSERQISEVQINKAKLIVSQEEVSLNEEKAKIEKSIDNQKTFTDFLSKWFVC